MKSFCLLVDSDSGNVASEYETQEQALDALRALYDSDGPDAVQNYLHLRGDATGDQTLMAAQGELVELALETVIARP